MSADKNRQKPSTKHTLEEVLRALQDVVRNELAESHPIDNQNENSASSAGESAPKPSALRRAKEAELQKTLIGQTGNEPASPMAKTQYPRKQQTEKAAPEEAELPVLTQVAVTSPTRQLRRKANASPDQTRRAPEQTSINWDDIPVLNDAVDSSTGPLFAMVRDIACKAVARLNISLRKAGQAPLDPVMIDRLETALRDTLLGLMNDKQKPPRH